MSKHYVFTDLHGNKSLYEQIKAFINAQPDAIGVFLGDAADRGEFGYSIITDMLQQPNIVYLFGNHEQLFINAAREFHAEAQNNGMTNYEYFKALSIRDAFDMQMTYIGESHSLWVMNGGASTMFSWLQAGGSMHIVNKLATLPYYYVINFEDCETPHSVVMCHAGCTAKEWKDFPEKATSKDFSVRNAAISSLVWNREHFDEEWPDGLMIHGHTPVPRLSHYYNIPIDKNKALRYNNKIDLDMLSVASGCACVYCVEDDTFHYFYDETIQSI